MIILQDTLVKPNIFWFDHYDFWISLLLGIVGVIASAIGIHYSKKAFREAKLAKDAAFKAGIVVKTQEIIMELERISNSCVLEEEIRFAEANKKLNEIGGRVFGILGMYKSDNNLKDQIQLIQDNIVSIKGALETANPSNPVSVFSDPEINGTMLINYVYNITAPHFSNLITSLNTLKGILNSRLIIA